MNDAAPAKADAPMCAAPIRDMRKPSLALPAQAADCHAHVFGPRDKYPYAATRLYTPPPVYLEDYLAMLRTAGFARGVLVQTGLYGNDNSFIIDAIKANPDQLRGIALIGEDITDKALLEKTMPNDRDLVDQIAVWVPDAAVRERILVTNAERLYGFERA